MLLNIKRIATLTVGLSLLLVSAGAPAAAAVGAEEASGGNKKGSKGFNPPIDEQTLRKGEAYYHLMEAMVAAREGSLREAVSRIGRASRAQPDSAELQGEAAQLMLGLGQRAEAEKLARRALELDDREPKALRLLADIAAGRALGGLHSDTRHRDEAIRLYEKLAERDEVENEVLRNLANLRVQAGDIDGAVAASKRLLEQLQGDVVIARSLTQLLAREGREGEALDTALEFIVRYGEEGSLIGLVSELADRTGNWEAVAVALTEREADESETSPALFRLRGEASLQTGRFVQAVDDFERASNAAPDDLALRSRLVQAYGFAGRFADASGMARQLAEDLPGQPQVQALLGQALARQRDHEGALAAMTEAAVGMAGGDARQRDYLHWQIAGIHLQEDRPDAALAELERLADPRHPDALEMRFRIAMAKGELDAAQAVAGQLDEAGSGGVAALLEGQVFVEQGNLRKADKSFERALQELGYPVIGARIAEIWRDAEQPERGEAVLLAWQKQDPEGKDAQAAFALGRYYERLLRFEEADRFLRRTIELEPENSDALNYLGYSFADRGVHLEEGLALIRRALKADPWNGAYLDSLGWALFKLDRLEEARPPLEQAALEHPFDPTVLEHLGDLYSRIGENALAANAWRRALAAGPEDPEAIRSKVETAVAQKGERSAEAQRERDRPE